MVGEQRSLAQPNRIGEQEQDPERLGQLKKTPFHLKLQLQMSLMNMRFVDTKQSRQIKRKIISFVGQNFSNNAPFLRYFMKKNEQSALLSGLITLLAAIPQPIWHRFVVPIVTQILWLGKTEFRRITEINIRLCYPSLSESERKKLGKDSIKETLKTFFEFPYVLVKSSEKSLKKVTNIDGQHFVDDALSKGRGVIFLSPHLGNWEFLGLKVGQDYDLTSLFKPGRIATVNHKLHKAREGSGAHLVPTNKKGVLALFKALKRVKTIGILPDQVPDGRNGCVYVDFFGEEVATMTLVSNLIKKTGAQAIGCFAKREPNGEFTIVYRPADEGIYSNDEEVSARAMNKTVESLIAIAPEQYQWIYKRFRYNRHGKRAIYKR